MTTTRHQRAKRPATVVAGPYGHPFHPMLVTVPIGAWVMSFVFDLASRWVRDPDVFAKGAFWLIGAGVVGALVAAVFGFMDLLAIPRGTKAFRIAVTHMILNMTVVGLFFVSMALRRGALDGPVALPPIVVSAVALALLAVSGWLGGELTYRYGVRVADEEKQAEAY